MGSQLKYFTIERIKAAIDHLSNYDSNWVLVPLVLAANGVNDKELKKVDAKKFLSNFFSGELMGLPSFENGNNNLRPKFSDIKQSLAAPNNYVLHQKVALWGSGYSSRGYREMRSKGILLGERAQFQTSPVFPDVFNAKLDNSFHFEEMLVWLYAFSGLIENINSWEELFDDFQSNKLNGIHFDPVFLSRFNVSNGIPFPDTIPNRPTNEQFQEQLLPSSKQQFQSLDDLIKAFLRDASSVDLECNQQILTRIIASLLTKRFLIISGLAGSGKTKLLQSFARWIVPKPNKGADNTPHYLLLPVGAGWTGNENILGYPDGLNPTQYVTTPALELIIHAIKTTEEKIPHFLILDEMNLSHVERYFSDILSAIESGEKIPLYEPSIDEKGKKVIRSGVPDRLKLPENLFIMGTVNVDETTYMFSPKVLDRAQVIEFHVEKSEIDSFLTKVKSPKIEDLDGRGVQFGPFLLMKAADKTITVPEEVKSIYQSEMLLFFSILKEFNLEFGYRVAYESGRFINYYKTLEPVNNTQWFKASIDSVIVQKFLPKLSGSRLRLENLLWSLASACWFEPLPFSNEGERQKSYSDFLTKCKQAGVDRDSNVFWLTETDKKISGTPRYPLSHEKLLRMWRKLVRDQFTSFAEA